MAAVIDCLAKGSAATKLSVLYVLYVHYFVLFKWLSETLLFRIHWTRTNHTHRCNKLLIDTIRGSEYVK